MPSSYDDQSGNNPSSQSKQQPEKHSSPPPPQKSYNDSSPPSPKSDNHSSLPPPPKNSSNSRPPSSKDSSKSHSPPPPKSKNSPSTHSPPHHRSPPPHHGSRSRAITPPSEKGNSRSSHHNDGFHITSKELEVIIGITAAVAVLLIIMILICISSCKKKKRRRVAMNYHMDQGPNGEYYSGSQPPNWQNGPMNHVIKLNPSSSSSGPPSGGWLQLPLPPPPPMSSGEVSSNFSGPHLPARPPPAPTIAFGFSQCTFTYEELSTATNGFSQANLLGQGGFGYVHKGVLPNGKLVAVKSLKSGSGQGEREFQAEVEIISRVHHRHLVSLVGYCIASGQRMLIYEFVPNNTLEYHLHGKDQPLMEWSKRITIALGAAKGLAYLHEDCHPHIIHRDIKASNILIDNNWEAMVADFGLAKLTDTNHTHVSTRVMGTFGYLAPEYASSGKLTEKSDVFSYGVMLLELITGRRPIDTTGQCMDENLVDWARPILTRGLGDGNYEELIDPRLDDNYNPHEMARMVACASASIRHSAKRRPKMSQIVRASEGDVSLDDFNNTVRPEQNSPVGSNRSSEYDTAAYNADMKKFRNIALNSEDYPSS